jgi:hypothetical protein
MALTADDVLSRASEILLDETRILWPEAKLLAHLNDAQREIVNLRPDAGAQVDAVRLDTGVKQTLPTGSLRLLDMPRNLTFINHMQIAATLEDMTLAIALDIPINGLTLAATLEDMTLAITLDSWLSSVWDNAKQSGGLSLDVTNLIVTRTSGAGNQIIYGTEGQSTGKWWSEHVVTIPGGSSAYAVGWGFMNPGINTTNAAYRNAGEVIVSGTSTFGLPTYITGDVINCAIDIDGMTVEWLLNGSSIGVFPFDSTDTGETWYSMASMHINASVVMTRRQVDMTNPPPAGYRSYFG